jgi:hypothetical protein
MKIDKKYCLIYVAGCLLFSGCSTNVHLTRWEYKVVLSGDVKRNTGEHVNYGKDQETIMDNLGKDGWVYVNESSGYLYFKRPIK